MDADGEGVLRQERLRLEGRAARGTHQGLYGRRRGAVVSPFFVPLYVAPFSILVSILSDFFFVSTCRMSTASPAKRRRKTELPKRLCGNRDSDLSIIYELVIENTL